MGQGRSGRGSGPGSEPGPGPVVSTSQVVVAEGCFRHMAVINARPRNMLLSLPLFNPSGLRPDRRGSPNPFFCVSGQVVEILHRVLAWKGGHYRDLLLSFSEYRFLCFSLYLFGVFWGGETPRRRDFRREGLRKEGGGS